MRAARPTTISMAAVSMEDVTAASARDRRRAVALRALGVSLALTLTTTLLAFGIYEDRQQQLGATTEVVSRQAGSHLAAWFDARFALAAALADRTARDGVFDPDVFLAEAATMQARTPGLLALNWVDVDGLIRLVYPAVGNERALGRNLFEHPEPDVARALGEARRGVIVTRTRNIELFQGGSGFAIYWPVQTADGTLLGFVNAVVRAAELMAASELARNLGEGYWLELRDVDGAVAWSNAPQPGPWNLAREQQVAIPGLDWMLTLAPTPAYRSTIVATPQLILWLVASYLLALWIGWTVWRRGLRQENLRDSERVLRALLDLLPHPVYVKDEDSHFIFVNRALAEASGKQASALVGQGSEALPGSEDEHLRLDEGDLTALRGEPTAVEELPFTDAAGRKRLLQTARVVFHDPVTDAPAVLGIGVDVTARHEAEALRARIATALNQAGEAIAVLDIQGRVEFANAAFTKMMAFSGDEVRGLGMDAFTVRGSKDKDLLAEIRATLRRGEIWRRRYTSDWHDGPRVRDASVAPFRGADGKLAGFIGVLRDVTRETELEDELRQSQKLEAVGRLSGGIAHDFNNLLTVILGYAEVIRLNPAADVTADAAREIHRAAERAAELTRQLLTFSRRGKPGAAACELNAVVSELMPMLERLIGEHIAIEQHLEPEVGIVAVDKVEIEQIIVNLCVNARDAMPEGGRLLVTTNLSSTDQSPPGLRPKLHGGPFAVLSVTDTGTGMTSEVQERIFEPFFTTKQVGSGTGLGLSTIYGIVEQRGGAVHVDSTPGRGSTLSVWLPVGRTSQLPVEEASEWVGEPERAANAGASILVAEDEPGILKFMMASLERAGYRVVGAADGNEALQAAETMPVIDLLVTDIVMPRMGGLELRARLLAERGELNVLFVSGYAPDESRAGRLGSDDVLIEKPFRAQRLLDEVAKRLDRSRGMQ
ncbi:MAG: PAS domain-containing protein [Gammaproteobacteria bacterium]|nr:PAS domain-containing protein [Gammaproteobacteria bacterium]